MEFAAYAALLLTLVTYVKTFMAMFEGDIEGDRADARKSVIWQTAAYAAGVALAFLVAESTAGSAQEYLGVVLGDANAADKVLIGLQAAGVAGVGVKALNAVDNARTNRII